MSFEGVFNGQKHMHWLSMVLSHLCMNDVQLCISWAMIFFGAFLESRKVEDMIGSYGLYCIVMLSLH